ncbi:DEAD/DEAH box helicase [Candidatus Woesearchaeota archaeon]|nr:DEAD/DEAH box helicase [Candidatus Woesearchaeota archaeon]
MDVEKIRKDIHQKAYNNLKNRIKTFRPSQEKSIKKGLLKGEDLLVCTPTASGKTLIAEMAFLNNYYKDGTKAVYVVPLKALASEKYKEFKKSYPDLKIAISIGDTDSADTYLERYDVIIATSEKLDSLIRHKSPFINRLGTVIIDEVHLLNDASRGPTLEVVITILKKILRKTQFLYLSATIGNQKELTSWLNASLVEDNWRPVRLDKGVHREGTITFYD